MSVELQVHRERVVGVPWWALAWYTKVTDGPGTVHVRSPFHLVFFPFCRLAHELAHHDGADHHPWWHFCIRSPHAIRTWRHGTRTFREVVFFRHDGRLP